MAGTVNAIVPLSLLEAVRSVDIPVGDDIDVEYVQEHRNKRLGLSDTVIAQIRRYKEAMERNQQIAIHEASGIARLIGRRSDAEGIFTRAGSIFANRVYEMISSTTRQIIHLLPGFLARPLSARSRRQERNTSVLRCVVSAHRSCLRSRNRSPSRPPPAASGASTMS